jgi:dolichyl-phosphate-mannose--protein O-mannosyl transferase
VTAIALAVRLPGLADPNKLVFDETYYAKDAYSLLKFGYERSWPSNANDSVTAGTPDVMQSGSSFIVHPPVGKWLIAGGEQLFGMNSFGWRFASLVFGTLFVLVTIRLVRRVSRSTLVGGIAGLLLTFDGLSFVMSRTALLDIFLAFFVVAAVACLAAALATLVLAVAAAIQRLTRAALVGAATALGAPAVGFGLLVLLFFTVIGPCLD